MASSSSSSSSAAARGGPQSTGATWPVEFSDDLKPGEVVIPFRATGETGPEKPVIYPTKWPAHIEAVMKKRGDKPIRLYADG
jgi:hypothetical protein